MSLLAAALRGRVRIAVDVCWGSRLGQAPTLIDRADCSAGRDFVVVTSDRQVMPCSFHDLKVPIDTVDDVITAWQRIAHGRPASAIPGCARRDDFGLSSSAPVPIALGRTR